MSSAICRNGRAKLMFVVAPPWRALKGAPLIPSPNHGDGSSEASAHVKGKETLYPFNLPRFRLFSQLLVSIKYLTHAGRSNRMAVANQAATGVDRNLPADFAADMFAPDLRKRGRSALRQLGTFPLLRQAKNFVSDDFGNRETIVHFGALNVARLELGHRESILGSLTGGRKCRCIFLLQREVIGGVTKTEQTRER